MPYTTILTETRGRVGLITLNRPEAMNALNPTILGELMDALEAFDADDAIGAMVITGNEKVFAAGADIKEMAEASEEQMRAKSFYRPVQPYPGDQETGHCCGIRLGPGRRL